MDTAIRKAETLIEALSYIRNFRDRLTVIKLGGSAMEDPDALRATLQDVVFMETVGMRPILVHGGAHGPVDRLAAAVDQHRPQADGLHEDDVLQGGVQGGGVFHGAAAELDHGAAAAEGADVVERLDERFGLAERVVHRRQVRGGGPKESL